MGVHALNISDAQFPTTSGHFKTFVIWFLMWLVFQLIQMYNVVLYAL
jgi:hypothetical protein